MSENELRRLASKMVLLIDNYDSFVHNLARYFRRLGQETHVIRNDSISTAAIRQLRPAAIVLSPGPCTPAEAGVSLDLVTELHAEVPILGVCLGHQTIAQALGGSVIRANMPVHGQASVIRHSGTGLFANLPTTFKVGRYHSLVVCPKSLPATLRPTAWTDDGTLIAFEHTKYPVFGVQFHPESILTEHGHELLANFLTLAGVHRERHQDWLAMNELRLHQIASSALPDRPITF